MFKPVHNSDFEAATTLKNGMVYRADVKQPRNLQFHRKFFVLLNLAYDYWEPQPVCGINITKNFDQFRKDLIIQAGYYKQVFRLDGSFTLIAKSISFGKMKQDEFDDLYGAVCNVIMSQVLTDWVISDLETALREIGEFA